MRQKTIKSRKTAIFRNTTPLDPPLSGGEGDPQRKSGCFKSLPNSLRYTFCSIQFLLDNASLKKYERFPKQTHIHQKTIDARKAAIFKGQPPLIPPYQGGEADAQRKGICFRFLSNSLRYNFCSSNFCSIQFLFEQFLFEQFLFEQFLLDTIFARYNFCSIQFLLDTLSCG